MKVAVVGLGYFSRFHLAAWHGIDGVTIVGGVDPSAAQRRWAKEAYSVPTFAGLSDVLDAAPDVVDISAPPSAHLGLIGACAAKGRVLVCQKPFCMSLAEAETAVALAEERGATLIVHENFRFQPWHRTIKAFLESGRLGQVYSCQFNLRPGDGRGSDAYLARQPTFQKMPRFLMQETAVHFVDLFRWMFGEVQSVYAEIGRLNPVIAGEDTGVMILNHTGGVRSVFDGNRLADHVTDNPRRTMGVMWIEGEDGTLMLDGTGVVTFRPFGSQTPEILPQIEPVDEASFGGGCVAALIRHVADVVRDGGVYENEAADYLAVIRATEAAYASARTGAKVKL